MTVPNSSHQIQYLSKVAIAAVAVAAGANSASAKVEITFGVVPQQSASRLAQVWMPILNRLSEDARVKMRFVTAKDIPSFERCLAQRAYDIAYMNPLHYVHFHAFSRYQAMAKRQGKKLKGILVTRKDSHLKNIRELNGVELAFPSPAAFGASVLPRAELLRQNINFRAKYVVSHDSVYRAVAAGILKAGGGVFRTFNTLRVETRSQLRVFYTTGAYTPHAIAHRNDLPEDVVDRIKTALINLRERSPTRLKKLGVAAFEAAEDQDWNDVRALNISNEHFDTKEPTEQKCR